MKIIIDDLSSGEVIKLLEEHLADMYATSPPENVHALDVNKLKSPDITFLVAGLMAICKAVKKLDSSHLELKSMRTSTSARKSGVATKLLQHALNFATEQGYQKVSLETGSQAFFEPARNLYKKFGFSYCGPFSDYIEDPHSRFMTINLS